MASKCISKLPWSQPPSASPNSLITASKCTSTLAGARPRTGSLSSLDHLLQVQLQTHLITASKLISKFTRSQCGETVELDSGLPIIKIPPHLTCHPKGILQKQLLWLEKHQKRVRGYEGLSGHDEPHTLCGSMNAWQECVRNHTKCVDLWKLHNSAWGSTQIAWIYECSARVCETKSWERQSVYFI